MKTLTRMKLILGALLIGLMLTHQPAKAHEPEYVVNIITGAIGYQLGRQSVQPTVVYQPIPVPVQTIIIDSSQASTYNPATFGYCGAYKGQQYHHCLGLTQRRLNNEAYQRGLNGQ